MDNLENNFGTSSLNDLPKLKKFKRLRKSSFDKTGGNFDFTVIAPSEKLIIFDVDGPGCINHIWTTQSCFGSKFWPRHIIIRIWWDNEENPSVECPLGDFFGMGHGERKNFISEPIQMSPENGQGLNCWWKMPFKKHARIEIENDNPDSFTFNTDGLYDEKGKLHVGRGLKNRNKLKLPGINIYYYIDYEKYDKWPKGDEQIGYFHSNFKRIDYKKDMTHDPDAGFKYGFVQWQLDGGKNTRKNGGYDRNHIIVHAKGIGQYVGCNINIDNRRRWFMNWPGEGDDMIWIDDDIGNEPTIYGTGTEDYVNMAYCPQQEYSAPYHGLIKGGGRNWNGKITYYRYHIQDPIPFEKEILVTIEHGHNNTRGDIWETTAYWYQLEPHIKFPEFPNRKDRMPRKNKKLGKLFSKFLKYTMLLTSTFLIYWMFREIVDRIIGI